MICDGLSVCVATDKIRPCTAAELLAYQYMQSHGREPNPVAETTNQQAFIDERQDHDGASHAPAPLLKSEDIDDNEEGQGEDQ